MNFVIHSMGMPFNGKTLKHASLGGSESAAYYMARILAGRGHRVIVFTNHPEEGVFDGVMYCHAGTASEQNPLGDKFSQFACNTPHDVLLIQRHHLGFHKDYASKINILQLHDLALLRSAGAMNAGGSRIDIVTTVSDFHGKQVKDVYGFREEIVRTVPNGVDLELYGNESDEATHPAVAEVLKHTGLRYLYQSRPERGLEHLVRPGGIMERLLEQGSEAHLFVCGYDNTTPNMAAYYQQLNEYAARLSNVTVLGALPKSVLAKVQGVCNALVYPTEFEEVSCITAMEAMAAGLPFISSACGALPETCKASGSILIPMLDGKADEDEFVKALTTWESNPAGHAAYRDAQLEAAQLRSWDHAVDVLETHIETAMAKRRISDARVARHLIEHSDIVALEEAIDRGYVRGSNAIAEKALEELKTMYKFARGNKRDVEDHYEHFESDAWDRLEMSGGVGEEELQAVRNTTRYRGIAHLVGVATAGKPAADVVEFGCSYGHISLNLARDFPNVKFTGIDFMQTSVDLANKAAEKFGLTNVSFICGSLERIPQGVDVLLAPEVIEHIHDAHGATQKMLDAVKVNGNLITTTPNGRWEWIGRKNWMLGREHLHHFERDDLVDMFSGMPHQILHAPHGSDGSGGAVGSWLVSATKTEDAQIRSINYARKFENLVPRDTVSLCMIVHNAEETIISALRSICPWVDEVVIGIDPKTNDRTRARVREVELEFPHLSWNVFDAESPLEIGFDAARNATIDRSCGDWIFWMDADEVVVDGRNIIRCLRPGAFNAYAIAQHHMSRQPATCLTTDYPCRLFRRDSRARFYGVVHEHPEVDVGGAIPHSQQLTDVSIIHYGYHDETARRGRFSRNFPLLLQDIEKNPNRVLNKFLYVRDLAQSIAFEGEQLGGVSEQMVELAQKTVDIYSKMIDENPMLRMILDALPYYSTASATLGPGFRATVSIGADNDIPGMRRDFRVEGHFHSIELYERLIKRVARESVASFDHKYM